MRSAAPQNLNPVIRRLLLLAADAALMPLALWLSFWLRLDQPLSDQWLQSGPWMVAVLWIVGLPLLLFSGQYKGLTRYVGSRSLYQLAGRMAVLALGLLAIGVLLRLALPPRSCWVLFWAKSQTLGCTKSQKKRQQKARARSAPFVDEAVFKTFGIIPNECATQSQDEEKGQPL